MTVTTNYLVTGNGITGSTANAVQALVSGDGLRFRNGPILVAHRGGSKTQVENTMQAFRKARSSGVTHIELDVFKLASGGKLGCHHDSTIDRMTSGTGNVESQTVANWLALTNDVYASIAPGILTGAPTLFDEVLDWARDNEVVLWVEPKAASGNGLDTYRRLNAELVARSWPRSKMVVETFSTTVAAAAAADGWRSWYLVGSGYTTADIDAAVTAGAWAVGMPFANWTQPLVAYAKARALVTVAYTVDRRYDAATVAGYGIDYIVSGDPVYVSETVRTTRDVWDTQAYVPGMLDGGNNQPTDTGVARGQWFSANGYYGWPTAAQHDACLQGYACPIKGNAAADNFTIRWQFQFNTVSSDTRWVGIHCCAQDDRRYQDTLATLLGYNILFRRNASVDIYTTPASGASRSNQAGRTTAPNYHGGWRPNWTQYIEKCSAVSAARCGRKREWRLARRKMPFPATIGETASTASSSSRAGASSRYRIRCSRGIRTP